MDIQASYKWLKEYLGDDFAPERFSKEVTAKAFPVDYTHRLSDAFESTVVGEVKEVRAHPDADKLKLAMVDVGAYGNAPVQIVCGGSNLAVGMRVFVALPGARVRWHGEGDLVELKETKIRGVSSFGMICAPSEVGFEKAFCPLGGIWDLTDWTSAKPGTSVVEALGLDDTVFDVEITTNRPDAMGIIGLAREAGAAMGVPFVFDPPALSTFSHPERAVGESKDLRVRVEDTQACPRYMAVVIDGVKVEPSPAWLQLRLLLAGHRPINTIVDITNYVLREYGQPMHAFDYDKLQDGTIVVRRAKQGERIKALDEQEYELEKDDLVIADSKQPIAIAGVMGGFDSGTWDATRTIVFEAATFDPVCVRKTARRHFLSSDSQQLFEKGLSSQSPEAALARAVELALEIAGGQVASAVVDQRAGVYEPKVFPFRPQRARDLIGVDLTDQQMTDLLERVGFAVQKDGDAYSVTVPFWRAHDIEHEVDFIEEIARLYGYHNMPAELPSSPPPTTPEDPALGWEMTTKKLFAGFGYTELYGYSMMSVEDLLRYDLDPAQAVQIHNPLSSDLTHMRPSLMPSLLRDIERNQGQRRSGELFELQRVYVPQREYLPQERTELVIARYGGDDSEQAFFALKGVLESWAKVAGLALTFESIGNDAHWHPTRSAVVRVDNVDVGRLGQISQKDQEAFGIDRPVIAACIDFASIVSKMNIVRRYEPIPEFPSVTRDIAVLLDESITYKDVAAALQEVDVLVRRVDLVEVYRGEGIEAGKKSMTFSFTLRSDDKTLLSQEIDSVMGRAAELLQTRFAGTIR